jgi:hypothetical protein
VGKGNKTMRDLSMTTLLNLFVWHRKQRDNALRVQKRTKNNQLRQQLTKEIDRFHGISNIIADEIDRRTGNVASVSVPSRSSGKKRRHEANSQLKPHQPERRIKAA